MAKAGYVAVTGAAVALTGGAAKSVLGVLSGATFGLDLQAFKVSFDGVTASAVPALVEVCYCTFATNPPGTASTTVTPLQAYGRLIAHGTTAARNWTTEPTVLTVLDEFLLTPNGGLIDEWVPLGQTPDSAEGDGFALRLNAPANVNVRAGMKWERC
jgi:hypothetical protein